MNERFHALSWSDPKALPDRLAFGVAKHEVIVAPFDLASQNGVLPFKGHLGAGDFDGIALLKSNFIALHELRGRNMNLNQLSIQLDEKVRAHAPADGTLTILNFVHYAFKLGLGRDVVLGNVDALGMSLSRE